MGNVILFEVRETPSKNRDVDIFDKVKKKNKKQKTKEEELRRAHNESIARMFRPKKDK